jgi:hypothetical protein
MMNEIKILFENIKNFRHLITESVGDNDIIDAIQNHEYVYIYYEGDGSNKSGYRTIRPFVLGTSTAGNKVIRAWQDRGKSNSLSANSPRKRYEHEYWTDTLDNKEKPGWRLFRLDRISSIYPTGKKFVDNTGKVIVPPKYNEGADEQMSSIIAYVSTKTPEMKTSGTDSIDQPDVVGQKVSQFDTQTSKWKRFYDANKEKRKTTAQDIRKLYDIAKRVMKKSPNNFIVVINNKNEFELQDIRNKDKIPPQAIVGNLTNLYDKLVKPPVSSDTAMQNFAKQEKEKMKKESKPALPVKENNSIISTKRKSFFKS